MVAPVFRESAFVWVCASMLGVCVLAALVLWQRRFLLGLSERFVRLPPSTKAVIVTAVVVATVFAQKPANVSTDFTDLHGFGEGVSATPNAEDEEKRRHGEASTDFTDSHGSGEGGATNLHESARISIRENPCQFVDKVSTDGTGTPCLPSSDPSVFSAAGNPTLSSNDVVRGYRLEAVRTNATVSYTRPANARLVGTWHLTDAYRGRAWVRLLSTNQHESTQIPIRENPRQSVANPLTPFRFPLGNHVVTSLWAHTWGKVRPQLRNASNEIAVIDAPMFARHGQSYLWTAATANGSVLLTWENFFLGNPYEGGTVPGGKVEKCEEVSAASHRSTVPLLHFSTVTVQLELFPNGDFIARSNEVERAYRRVNPDDWDDDGIPNDEDDAPLVAADEPQFGPRQTLPEGANAEAYCWVDLVVRRANAKVTFMGDGASNLADPTFIAEADATNRVTLLIGKTYRVTCPMPFELVGKSSDDIEESWESARAALWLHWPVRISLEGLGGLEGSESSEGSESLAATNLHESTRMPAALNTEETENGRRGESYKRAYQTVASATLICSPCLRPSYTSVFSDSNLSSFTLLSTFQTFVKPSNPSKLPKPSKPFTMQVSPSGLGGAFTWTNVCCRVSGSGYTFSITCGDGCSCGGCSATGYLEYEGYRLPAHGGFCGCGGYVDHPGGETDPDERPPLPGASATFSKRVVFFEDEYENAPGETVPWQSTETRLDCWAYGGTRGGHVRIEIAGADGLVPYGGSPLPFEQDLEPGEEVAFETAYRAVRPSGGKDDIVVTATFTENETGWTATTVDKATAVQVIVCPKIPAPENESFGRHKYGVREEASCLYFPSSASVAWQTDDGDMLDDGTFVCPLAATRNPLTISGGGATYTPNVSVVEPQGIECRNVKAERYCVPVNHAGGIGMLMDLHVLPLDVSFTGIAVEEVPCLEGTHTGYFANPRFSGVWSHTVENGAGNWIDIQEENLFGEDRPAITGELSRVTADGVFVSDVSYGWQDGELVWPIPYGWNEKGTRRGSSEYKRFGTDTRHWTIIFRNGRSGIRKLQNQVYRDIDGTVNLNGRIVDEDE